jgi:hypothetical protein
MKLPSEVHGLAHYIVYGPGHEAVEVEVEDE